MSKIEEMLRKKISPEDFELAKQIFEQPISKIRSFIQERIDEVETE